MTDSRICIALDFQNKAEVKEFLEKFNDEKLYVKVGMELFYGEGIEIIKMIKEMGHNIFLDLKLHDIPNTVKSAMKQLCWKRKRNPGWRQTRWEEKPERNLRWNTPETG